MVKVFIPAELRSLTAGQLTVDVTARTAADAIEAVDQQFPGIKARVVVGQKLRTGLMLVVDGRAATRGLREPLAAGQELHIVHAVGGG